MHTCLDVRFYITILLFMGIAEELMLGALALFAGVFLPY